MENDDFCLRAEDMLLLDIGSSTFTKWETCPEIMTYEVEHPELLNCKEGFIHSHNRMSTFFSGTDNDTLLEFGQEYANLLSLIVNNAGTYNAIYTVHYSEKKISKGVRTIYSSNGTREVQFESPESSCNVVDGYIMKVEIEHREKSFQELDADIDDILKKKEEEKKKQQTSYKSAFSIPTKPWSDKSWWDDNDDYYPPYDNSKQLALFEAPLHYQDEATGLPLPDPKTIRKKTSQLITCSVMTDDDFDYSDESEIKSVSSKLDNELPPEYYDSMVESFIDLLVTDRLDEFYPEDVIRDNSSEYLQDTIIFSILTELEGCPEFPKLPVLKDELENYLQTDAYQ